MGSKGCKWLSLNSQGNENPLSHPLLGLGLGRTPPSNYWPSGVIRIGLPVWKWKWWKISWIKEVQRDANGSVWIPKALKTLSLIYFWGWENSTFHLLALWGNKNWPPSMKVKKLENFQEVRGAKGCKWSSLNIQGTKPPLSHPILRLDEFPFPAIRAGSEWIFPVIFWKIGNYLASVMWLVEMRMDEALWLADHR